MMIAMTPANTGRWMKKRDTDFFPLSRLLHLHRRAGPQPRQVVEDHRVAGLEAVEHHPVGAQPRAGADLALHRGAFAAHHPDEAAGLVLRRSEEHTSELQSQ